MPTTVKSTSNLAKLGELATYTVNSAAVPRAATDTSGSVPTLSATFVDGTDTDFLVGERLTLASPTISSFEGEVVSLRRSAASNKYSVDVDSILARLNAEIRTYPLSDFIGSSTGWIPLYSLEYWTQQCGIFYRKVPGDVQFYQSYWGHFAAFAKDIVRPIRSVRSSTSSEGVPTLFTDGNLYLSSGNGYTAATNFPDPSRANPNGSYLPVMVPLTAKGVVVFGADMVLRGTGRSANLTWHMNNAQGKKVAVRIQMNNSTLNIQTASVAGTYTTRYTPFLSQDVPYHVSVGLSTTINARTRVQVSIVNTLTGVQVGTYTGDFTMPLTGNMSLRSMIWASVATGSDNQHLVSNAYISQMTAMPTSVYPVQKVLNLGYKGADFMVGFSGNAWEHIKQYCSIYHMDISYQNGQLVFGPRQRDTTYVPEYAELSTTIANREQARNVEVVNRQHTATGPNPKLMWKADSVYQVAVGEVQEFNVQTDHSILTLSQPVCVTGITPFPYKAGAGQYVVTGSDGYIVSPAFWAAQGGRISADTTDVEGEIKITIKGPDYDSPRAPYRISEGDAGRPALYITGEGVTAKPKTLKISTGNSKAAKDVGIKIDSPFIGHARTAYNVAAMASHDYASPERSVRVAIPVEYDKTSKLGVAPAGKMIKRNGNVLRVLAATQDKSSVQATGEQHNTVYQVNRSFEGATIAQRNAYYAGKKISQQNTRPLKELK